MTPVLVLNSGSSSLKFGLADVGPDVAWRFEGEADDAEAGWRQVDGKLAGEQPGVVGHRVVHGGPALQRHCVIDDAVLKQLEAAEPFAPLHVPPALEIIRAARDRFPNATHVACLDTAFHATLPEVARTLPIAIEWRERGIRRYGFHGLSCESIVRQLGRPPTRLVIAHLGNGASITAVLGGRSIDTSMGLTPSGGVMMGSRSGDLDPGVLIHLLRAHGLDADKLEQLVDHDAGLRGVSGLSNDMRRLHADPRGELAVRMFCRSVAKQVAAMAAVLGGIDLLVFTGGIGENDAAVRSTITQELAWMRFDTQVLPSQEDREIALHSAELAR